MAFSSLPFSFLQPHMDMISHCALIVNVYFSPCKFYFASNQTKIWFDYLPTRQYDRAISNKELAITASWTADLRGKQNAANSPMATPMSRRLITYPPC
jgi:hypothetical protein